jgi:hypothetical protein
LGVACDPSNAGVVETGQKRHPGVEDVGLKVTRSRDRHTDRRSHPFGVRGFKSHPPHLSPCSKNRYDTLPVDQARFAVSWSESYCWQFKPIRSNNLPTNPPNATIKQAGPVLSRTRISSPLGTTIFRKASNSPAFRRASWPDFVHIQDASLIAGSGRDFKLMARGVDSMPLQHTGEGEGAKTCADDCDGLPTARSFLPL